MVANTDNYIQTFRSAIARIFHANGAVVGVGFLVSGRTRNYILTCAHVVTSALSLPEDIVEAPNNDIYLDFPLIASGQQLKAKVVFWQPVVSNASTSEPEDIAGLQIEGQLPKETQAIQLIRGNNIWQHPFRIFGFPNGHNDGVWATGVLRDGQGKGWVQLEDSKVTGYRIEPGFSGAPIWDETLVGVVGMAVAAEMRREDIKTAFMIPADVLIEAWDEIDKPISSHAHIQNISSRVQQLKIKTLQQRFDVLSSDYEVAYNQLNYTLSASDRNIIQRQIDSILQELERVESELNTINN
ncbi:MAG: trypsin-like peptidase domain-containing protein [Nostoc sp. DedQUE04]|uniref:trypsin-like peptidase domain-containing protein n=1 Tax=Nostoc sp. DedQUE04 TaxID=3075390 RepID=UPI002AD392CE|nr:trypsin-like peptidase domain-containing protein [Nostoc sp. DedQUE04]MDZ8137116.1 trypsin-like peptidase domain-containing protein [Nostoc sp. DedQUE04]